MSERRPLVLTGKALAAGIDDPTVSVSRAIWIFSSTDMDRDSSSKRSKSEISRASSSGAGNPLCGSWAVARVICTVSSTSRSIDCLEISEVEAEAELDPKNRRKPKRFSCAWLIFSTSPSRTVTKNESLSTITTSPAVAPFFFASARMSPARS